MHTLLVTYDLKNKEQDYSTFYDMVHSYPYTKITETSCAIETTESPEEIFDGLWPWIDPHDRVMVFELAKSWSGIGSEEAQQWLKERVV